MSWKKSKKIMKKVWHFIWEDNSIWSWIVNIILAVLIIKFIIYPVLGLGLGTKLPVVAVVSSSMEHNSDFDTFWNAKGYFYTDPEYNITREDFENFKFKNGFNKGDIMIVTRAIPSKIKVGDVIVFQSPEPYPIIHRVVKKWQEDGIYYFRTKGDNNLGFTVQAQEKNIGESRVLGKANLRIPYLGNLKIVAACSWDYIKYKFSQGLSSQYNYIGCLT